MSGQWVVGSLWAVVRGRPGYRMGGVWLWWHRVGGAAS